MGLIVLSAPDFRRHFCLLQRCKYFSVEAFVPELLVEALDVAVLPRTARLDEKSPERPWPRTQARYPIGCVLGYRVSTSVLPEFVERLLSFAFERPLSPDTRG